MQRFFAIVSVLIMSFLCSRQSYAQALDPNCWKPTVGNGIETFEKSNLTYPNFGSGFMILPNNTDDSVHYYLGLAETQTPYNLDEYQANKPFNFQSMKFLKKLQINLSIDNLIFGHFRSPKLLDLFVGGNSPPPLPSHNGVGIIYWADSNGDYDTTRFTVLRSTVRGDYGFHGGGPFCVTHLTNDSLDDILMVGFTDWSGKYPDSAYKAFAILFQSNGNLLHDDTLAYNDSTLPWGPVFDSTGNIQIFARTSTTADFRGIGRKDWIGSDYKSNIFYYKNDAPFSMQKFLNAVYFDTLLASWQNPQLNNDVYKGSNRLVMRALPKQKGDSSMDFMPTFSTFNHYLENSFWIFRGGKDFGSKRLTIDSATVPTDTFQHAEFILRSPALFDGSFSGISFGGNGIDAGDMTGTGRPVLRTSAGYDFGVSYDMYYVLGNAIDEKIDIIVSYPVGVGSYYTPIDADGDRYKDIVYQAFSSYPNGSVTPDSSGLWILHGSPKIPIHLNPKYTVLKQISNSYVACTAFPNPADGGTTLSLFLSKSGEYTLGVWDILGRNLNSKKFFLEAGTSSLYFPTQSLHNGSYVFRLLGDGVDQNIKVVVHH